ncbi:MAG: KEOPS complex N(6)-L-threonylcarbamoyladenine synthase Kae1 [Candidatus Pacearchaeota archaeon]
MIVGIESTAHTFGIGVVNKGKIIANVKDVYTTKHGGIVPKDAAAHHVNVSNEVFKKAFEEAKAKVKDIKAIAFSSGPGLAPCLLEGMKFAKKLSYKCEVPLIPVNHCVAHLEIGRITGAKDSVLLYASGANTQIIAYAGGRYRVFGETLDNGIGNFIDGFARYIGLGFPGGPKIQELAKKGKKYIELPYSIKGMDISFSGMQTKLKQLYDKKSKDYSVEDLAFSLQETAFAMLVEASERAIAHLNKKELVIGGGVGCNIRLQEMCRIMCQERDAMFFAPPNSLLVDNGAMIAYLGEIIFNSKTYEKDLNKIDIFPRQRTDDIEVKWRK